MTSRVEEASKAEVEGDDFFSGGGLESEFGFGEVACGEGEVTCGEVGGERRSVGVQPGVGIDAVHGVGTFLGGEGVGGPTLCSAGEGVFAGFGADVTTEVELV